VVVALVCLVEHQIVVVLVEAHHKGLLVLALEQRIKVLQVVYLQAQQITIPHLAGVALVALVETQAKT
jgi:hypothetical protein